MGYRPKLVGVVSRGQTKVVVDMTDGRSKFRAWAQDHDRVPVEHGPRQSELGGRQITGTTHLREDDESNAERFRRSEEFLHKARETFPED